jgi:hypothetical protein
MPAEDGTYRLPPELDGKLPLFFSPQNQPAGSLI